MTVAVRTAEPRDADAVTAVFLASRAAAMPRLRPGRRRHGIGRLLIDTVRNAVPDGLTLHVFQRNTAARAFYEDAGFRVLEVGDGSGNEEGLPDLRYGWAPGG